MFFTGSLQEGIAEAMQSSKAVACFVTDEQEESQRWEDEFLTEESAARALRDHSVLLRLKAGSADAGYLTAIFPVPKNPTLVILRNGTLKEYIAAGVTKEDFVQRIQTALNGTLQPQAAPGSSSTPEPAEAAAPVPVPAPAPAPPAAPAEPSTSEQASSTEQPAVSAPETSSSTEDSPRAATPTTDSERPEAVRSVFAERAERLARLREEAKRKAQEAYARAKAKGKEKAEAPKDDDEDKKATSQASHAEAFKRKRREALEERNRILKQIEDDKAERRDRAAEKERAKRESTSGDVAAALTQAPASEIKRSTGMVSLQVRLFDGSTMRSRFPEGSTLGKEVRKWIDTERKDGPGPYKFKVVLTPLPNKTIEETEEENTLGELGLAPSSTLILVPIPKYTKAYPAAGNTDQDGIIARIIAFFAWLFGLIVGFVTSLFSTRPAPQGDQPPVRGQPQEPAHAGLRRRADRTERQRDYQLYNGNSLNFEPRPEDEDSN